MRILYVIDSLGRGGAEQALVNLLPAMRARGHEPEVAALWPPYAVGGDLEALGFRVHRLDISHRWNVLAGLKRVGELARLERYDVLHAHLFFAGLYTAYGAADLPDAVKVVTYHLENYAAWPPTNVWRKTHLQLERRAAHRHFDGVAAVSTPVGHHVAQLFRRSDVAVFPNAFPLAELTPRADLDRRSVLANFGVSDEEFVIVNAARLSPQKDHANLFESLQHLRGQGLRPRMIIVGDGPLREQLTAEVARRGISDQVILHPALPNAELMPLVQSADLFVMSSVWEGFPLAPAEAMALETPVVSTRVGGIPDLIEDGMSGILVPPSNASALAAAIARMMRDPELRRRIAVGGRERMLANFGAESLAARWDEYYQMLLSRKRERDASDTAPARKVS